MQTQLKNGDFLSVLKATRADIKEILHLQRAAYQSEAVLLGTTDIPPLRQTTADMELEFASSIFLKATDAHQNIIGSVRGYESNGTFYVGKLIVLPAMQRQNIGTILLQEIEKICGCTRIELFTSTKSAKNIKFYEKLGYAAFEQKKVSDTLTFVYFQKYTNNS